MKGSGLLLLATFAIMTAALLVGCGHKNDADMQNTVAYTETDSAVSYETECETSSECETDFTFSSGADSLDSLDDTESSGDDTDSSAEDDMRWKLFDEKDAESANYRHNSEIKIDGFVKYGQENSPVCDMVLGKTRFASVGCEVIAAYNYLLYIGEKPDIAQLAADFEKNALIAADGSLGSNPRRISGLFKALDIPYRKLYKAEEAQAALDEGRPVIIAFHIGDNVFSGIHTVFAVKEDGKIYVYNLYNTVKDQTEIGAIDELMKKNSLFIVGYTSL